MIGRAVETAALVEVERAFAPDWLEAGGGAPLGVNVAAVEAYLARRPADAEAYLRVAELTEDALLRADCLAEALAGGLAAEPDRTEPASVRRTAGWSLRLARARAGGDLEELARLREEVGREARRPATADLPLAAQRGLGALAERLAAPVLDLLDADLDELDPTAGLAAGMLSAERSERVLDGGRQRFEAALRSAAAERLTHATAAAAGWLQAAGRVYRVAPGGAVEGAMARTRDWLEALPAERQAGASRAWAEWAVLAAAGGDHRSAVALLAERVVAWSWRVAGLRRVALAAGPSARAWLETAGARPEAVELADQRHALAAALEAEDGRADTAEIALARIADAVVRQRALTEVVAALAAAEPHQAWRLWSGAAPPDGEAWLAAAWLSAGVAAAGDDEDRLRSVWALASDRSPGLGRAAWRSFLSAAGPLQNAGPRLRRAVWEAIDALPEPVDRGAVRASLAGHDGRLDEAAAVLDLHLPELLASRPSPRPWWLPERPEGWERVLLALPGERFARVAGPAWRRARRRGCHEVCRRAAGLVVERLTAHVAAAAAERAMVWRDALAERIDLALSAGRR